jgi:hypothetical protein
MQLPPETVTLPALVDTAEAAEYLGLSPAWFERDRWAGPRVPFIRFGRRVRYRADDLRAYIEASTVPSVK